MLSEAYKIADVGRGSSGLSVGPDRHRIVALRQSVTGLVSQQSVMQVGRHFKSEKVLEQNVDQCCFEKVFAAHDVSDALERVVDHDGQVIGRAKVSSGKDHVSDIVKEVFT